MQESSQNVMEHVDISIKCQTNALSQGRWSIFWKSFLTCVASASKPSLLLLRDVNAVWIMCPKMDGFILWQGDQQCT